MCVNFLQWADVATHILFGRRQMPAPEMAPGSKGNIWIPGWLCSCLCLWLCNAPWRRFMMSLWQSWHECLVSLATIFPLILIHLLSNIQYSGNRSPPHSNHKASDRGLVLNGISFSLVLEAVVFQFTSDCIQLYTEPSARPVGLRPSVRLQWDLTRISWTCEGFSEARKEPGLWGSFPRLLSCMGGTWLDEPIFFIFNVSLCLFLNCQDLKAVRTQTSSSTRALSCPFINSFPEKGCY